MSYSKFIHDYLDGELNDSQKDVLFAELAQNPDMRFEFDQHVRLNSIAKSDMSTISPPIETTYAIFSGLGFSIPSNGFIKNLSRNADRYNVAAQSSMRDFLKRHFSTILTAILASAVTALIILFYIRQTNPALVESTNNINGKGKSTLPMISSFENSNDNKSNNGIDKDNSLSNGNPYYAELAAGNSGKTGKTNKSGNSGNHNYKYGTHNTRSNNNRSLFADGRNQSNKSGLDENQLYGTDMGGNSITKLQQSGFYKENNSKDIAYNQFVNSESKNKQGKYADIIQANLVNGLNPGFDNKLTIDLTPFIDNTKYAVEFRNFTDIKNPSSDAQNPANRNFENMSIACLYKLNPYQAFGIEVGRQQFLLNYKWQTGTREQKSMYVWYGAFYRQSLPELSPIDNIYPYYQAFAGGTLGGPLLRAQAGVQLKYGNLSGTVAIEPVFLFYNVQGNLYLANKLGIAWGINYNF
jgi:hypothetical protein